MLFKFYHQKRNPSFLYEHSLLYQNTLLICYYCSPRLEDKRWYYYSHFIDHRLNTDILGEKVSNTYWCQQPALQRILWYIGLHRFKAQLPLGHHHLWASSIPTTYFTNMKTVITYRRSFLLNNLTRKMQRPVAMPRIESSSTEHHSTALNITQCF